MRIGRSENVSTPRPARAMPQPRWVAALRAGYSTFFPAEDRPQHAAQHLPAELGADAAGGAFRHRLDDSLRLAPAARPGAAEEDVVHRVVDRVRAFLRLRRLRLGAALQFLVGGFPVHRLLVVAEDVGGLDELRALVVGDGPDLAPGRHDERALDHAG